MCTALCENVERGSEGAIGAQLQGATVDKSAIGKYHLIPIAWRYTWDWTRQTERESGKQKKKRGAMERHSNELVPKGKGFGTSAPTKLRNGAHVPGD